MGSSSPVGKVVVGRAGSMSEITMVELSTTLPLLVSQPPFPVPCSNHRVSTSHSDFHISYEIAKEKYYTISVLTFEFLIFDGVTQICTVALCHNTHAMPVCSYIARAKRNGKEEEMHVKSITPAEKARLL